MFYDVTYTTKYNKLAHGTGIGHIVFTRDRKQQKHHNVKRNLNNKLQVSNNKIHFNRECVDLVTHTNFTAICVTEADI